jgi:hypothetical protein
MTSLRWDTVPKPRVERPPLLAPSSKSARRKQKLAGPEDRTEEAGGARAELQDFAQVARTGARAASATMRSGRCSACKARGISLWQVAGRLVCASCRTSNEMTYAPLSGRQQELGRRKATRKEGTMTVATAGKGIAWAARQGVDDRKAGTECRKYKNFLRIYNLPRSQFTLKMWNAYLPASHPARSVRPSASSLESKQKSRWTGGLTVGDVATPHRKIVRRYDLVMSYHSDLSPENAALLRKVNQLDTLVDMWR